MERYKISYVWKSLNGYCPDMGFEWNEDTNNSRSERNLLKYPKILGSICSAKTLQRKSLNYEGVRLFNSLPEDVRTFKGSKENFKVLLDAFLEIVPDQPETETEKPCVTNEDGYTSNSLVDWVRCKPNLKKTRLNVTRYWDDRGILRIIHNDK